ncbi:hypothetical protein ACFYXV_20220 [Streptomyces sp. NPDC002181]|uniref:hypothetical protein n=1 Tax=Streptomyces sp. NPDC002181 TaxID=3364635 RepID=UPI0036A7F5C4
MNTGRTERHFHLPEAVVRPEGLAPDTARFLELAVRRALADAVRAVGGRPAQPPPPAREEPRAGGGTAPEDGYQVPSYDAAGRPVTVPLRRAPRWGGDTAAGGPSGGLGLGAGAGTGGRNLGAGAGAGAGAGPGPGPGRTGRAAPAPPPPRERPWTPERLAALRTRGGHRYRDAVLGRISADSLVVGSTAVRLVPGLGGTDHERTIAVRLGAGAFYFEPVTVDRVGLAAAGTPGAAYAVHGVTDDGRRHDTGLRVITENTRSVPAGILAYTADFTTLREVRIVGRKPGDARAAAAAIAAALERGLAWAPGSIVTATMKEYLRGLDFDELMAAFEELRALGKLGDALALVRVRAFRTYLRERRVPWSFVFGNWEPNAADGVQVFAGILWGVGEFEYQALELLGTLAGSVFSARLAQERNQLWAALVTCVEHPVVTAQQGLSQLADAFKEKLDQLEFFDAGRIIGQLVMSLLALPEAVKSLPRIGGGAVRAVVAVNRIGVAVLDRIGLRLLDVVRLLLSERPSMATTTGVLLTVAEGDDILAAGAAAKGTSVISKAEVVKALEEGERFFTPAEVEELAKVLDEAEQRVPATPPAGAAAAVLSVDVLEELVARAIAEVGADIPSLAVRGTNLHSAFSRLVRRRFPGSGLTVISETNLRNFARLPASVLDMPIETYVKSTPGLAELEQQLSPLFTGKLGVRLIGDLRPDLVVRAPGRMVVFDLTGTQKIEHMAKNLLYTHVLREAGEAAFVGETYWRHFSMPPAEFARVYRKQIKAHELQLERARKRIRARHGTPPPGGPVTPE